ncbi:MAG: Ig-like domain repeat protein [Thermoplasmatota archaeon]
MLVPRTLQVLTAVSLASAFVLLTISADMPASSFSGFSLEFHPPLNLFLWPQQQARATLDPFQCTWTHDATQTNVSRAPVRVEKNDTFRVGGTWVGSSGAPIAGGPVTVFLNLTKKTPGVELGFATTASDGTWSLLAQAPRDAPASRYHVVAEGGPFPVGCAVEDVSWSDPELQVHAATTMSVACPERAAESTSFTCVARVVDVGGAAVTGVHVAVSVDGRELANDTTSVDGSLAIDVPGLAPGNHSIAARFSGTQDDGPSQGATRVLVGFALATGPSEVVLVRGEASALEAHVDPVAKFAGRSLAVAIEGVALSDPACAPSCGPEHALEVTIDATGGVRIPLVAARDADPGTGTVTLAGPFLVEPLVVAVRVVAGVHLTLVAPNATTIGMPVDLGLHLADDRGVPLAGAMLTFTRDGGATTQALVTDATGAASLDFGRLPAGAYTLTASFPGDATHESVQVSRVALVEVPWWLTALGVVAGLALVAGVALVARRFRPVPPPPPLPRFEVAIERPSDAARAFLAIGDALTLAAPLPAGATRCLVEAPDALEGARDVDPVDGVVRIELVARAKCASDIVVRALDAEGRDVAVGSTRIRVVEYAEDVERSFRALRARVVPAGPEHTTPRELEATLAAAYPRVPRDPLGRVVSIFEVADYSHRRITREDFIAFVTARREVGSVAEVGDDA